MQQNPGEESRRSARKRILKGAIIAFSGRHATLPAVLRDMSPMGARLAVQNAATVPDTFELLVELDGIEVNCRVVWRRTTEVGVSFMAEPVKVPPRRAQIVAPSSGAGPAGTIRRKPLAAPAPVAVATSVPADRPETMPAPALAPAALATPAAAKIAATLRHAIPIVIADDDPDDRMLIADAFRESAFSHPISFVENGEELLQYMRAQGPYAERNMPGLILLDLNMPKMDGRTALMHLKADMSLRRIPVIVLTTSNQEDDIQRTYELGVSAYVPKPNSFDGLMELVQSLNNYWMRFVALPVAAAS